MNAVDPAMHALVNQGHNVSDTVHMVQLDMEEISRQILKKSNKFIHLNKYEWVNESSHFNLFH